MIGPLALATAGAGAVPTLWAGASLALFAVYVLADVVLSAARDTRYGDASVLWSIHRPAAVMLLSAVAAVKVGVFGVVVSLG